LSVLWAREQVKKDLRNKGFSPIHVRCRPFGYWAQCEEIAFSVTFVDATGCIQTARCAVWHFNFRITWISDDDAYLDKNPPPIGRVIYLLLAGVLVWLGLRYLAAGQLVLASTSYISNDPIHIRGGALVLLCLAGFSLAASLLSERFYGYDRRGRERIFTIVTRGLRIVSWILFITSIAVFMYQGG
jgi:hypothetical protein